MKSILGPAMIGLVIWTTPSALANAYDSCNSFLPGIQLDANGDVSPTPSDKIASSGPTKEGSYQVTFTSPIGTDYRTVDTIKVFHDKDGKPREVQYQFKKDDGVIDGTSIFLKQDSSRNCVEDFSTDWTIGYNGKRISDVTFSPKACVAMEDFFKNKDLHIKDCLVASAPAHAGKCARLNSQGEALIQRMISSKIALPSTLFGDGKSVDRLSAAYGACEKGDPHLKSSYDSAREEWKSQNTIGSGKATVGGGVHGAD